MMMMALQRVNKYYPSKIILDYLEVFCFFRPPDIDVYFKSKMVVATGNTYHHSTCCKKLESFPHGVFYTAKDLQELRRLKLQLLAQNSTSKVSVYYTPPELQTDDDHGHHVVMASSNNLQISPIHINYIHENCSHPTDEFHCPRITRQFLLNTNAASPSIAIELNGGKADSQDDHQDKDTVEEEEEEKDKGFLPKNIIITYFDFKSLILRFICLCFAVEIKGAGDSASVFCLDNSNPRHPQTASKGGQVKSSKSCPVIYKMSRQLDGSTLHELLPSNSNNNQDTLKDVRRSVLMMMNQNNTSEEDEGETDDQYHQQQQQPTQAPKLNVVLNETGKCSLYSDDGADGGGGGGESSSRTTTTTMTTTTTKKKKITVVDVLSLERKSGQSAIVHEQSSYQRRIGHKRSFSLSSYTTTTAAAAANAATITGNHSSCDINKSYSFCIQTQNNVSSKSIRSRIMELTSSTSHAHTHAHHHSHSSSSS